MPNVETLVDVDRVLEDVYDERIRQEERWGEQNHPPLAPESAHWARRILYGAEAEEWKRENASRVQGDALAWDGILLEEVYEALAEEDPTRIREELIQVAAVAVCWVQAIDRQEAAK